MQGTTAATHNAAWTVVLGVLPALNALINPILHSQQNLLTCVFINLMADLADACILYIEVYPAALLPVLQGLA